MTTVKIGDDIHKIIKEKSKITGINIERIVDNILRPWYKKEKEKFEPKPKPKF